MPLLLTSVVSQAMRADVVKPVDIPPMTTTRDKKVVVQFDPTFCFGEQSKMLKENPTDIALHRVQDESRDDKSETAKISEYLQRTTVGLLQRIRSME